MAEESVKISELTEAHRNQLEGAFVPVAVPNQQTFKVPLEEFTDPLEIFVATYGTTLAATVATAIEAGKTIFAYRQVNSVNKIATLSDSSVGVYHFAHFNSDGSREIWELTSNGWTSEEVLATNDEKVKLDSSDATPGFLIEKTKELSALLQTAGAAEQSGRTAAQQALLECIQGLALCSSTDKWPNFLNNKIYAATNSGIKALLNSANVTLDGTTFKREWLEFSVDYDSDTMEIKNGKLAVKKASQNQSGFITDEQLEQAISAVESRVIESMPLGSVNTSVSTEGTGSSISLVLSAFVPQMDFKLTEDSIASLYVSQTISSGQNATLTPVLYRLVNIGTELNPQYKLQLQAFWSGILLVGQESEKRRHNSTGIVWFDDENDTCYSGETYYIGLFSNANSCNVIGISLSNASINDWPVLAAKWTNQFGSNQSSQATPYPLKYLYLNNTSSAPHDEQNYYLQPDGNGGVEWYGPFNFSSSSLGSIIDKKEYVIVFNTKDD